jgi:uncharacterized membrane protein
MGKSIEKDNFMRKVFTPLLMRITTIALMILGVMSSFQLVNAQPERVHAILFYSPSCPHCHKVINEDLPPLIEKYDEKLIILGINVSTPEGQELYQAAVRHFNIPENRIGVPSLIVGDIVLVGSIEIPAEFPKIIETALANGGIDWPDIPGLSSVISEGSENAQNNEDQKAPDDTLKAGAQTMNLVKTFALDPVANTIAVVILILMLISLITTVYLIFNNKGVEIKSWPKWVIPVSAVTGLGIAGYLSYVEVTHTEAVCGPVGNCNTVQQSPYAVIFGILPVGILGVFGYILIIMVWIIQYLGPNNIRSTASLAQWTIAALGVLFSIYLTFLEPFIIGASCAWCLTSAILMTLILWAATGPACQTRSQGRDFITS